MTKKTEKNILLILTLLMAVSSSVSVIPASLSCKSEAMRVQSHCVDAPEVLFNEHTCLTRYAGFQRLYSLIFYHPLVISEGVFCRAGWKNAYRAADDRSQNGFVSLLSLSCMLTI